METVGLVLAEYEATPFMDRPSEILVDSIGIGAGVVDRLRELGMPARGVNVAESPALGTRYQKLRDELWFRCREWFEARDCSMPEQEELIHELTAARFSILSSGKFKAEGKDQMKKRGLKSPDLADAFILTFGSQAVRAAGSVNAYGYSGDLNYGNSSWIV
jgi:phage terminase large subunit